MENRLYGGIEAGGTKFICAIGSASGDIVARAEIATTDPNQTLQAVCDFFRQNSKVASFGIGSFGPLDLNPSSQQFGFITSTPKSGWENTDIKGGLEKGLGAPAVIDTDVNCAAIGEKFFGAAGSNNNFVYITVGTGIGASVIINGQPFHGSGHLEIGHMRVPHEVFTDDFGGICSFHKDCLEGIASGSAMEQRWHAKAQEISSTPAWELEAEYLGTAINNLIMSVRPELFILGGGVMKHEGLIESIRMHVQKSVNNYVDVPALDSYIVASTNPNNAVLGAIKLAAASA